MEQRRSHLQGQEGVRAQKPKYTPHGALVLEDKSRLSHSMIWNWMRAFYDQQGVGAWSNGIVPNFVTTNCCIAKMYAEVIFGFLNDVFSPNGMREFKSDPSEPLYVVELGAGHGKFSFLLLKQLLKMKEFFPPTQTPNQFPFKFVMTDFTENNINFWKNHSSLKPFIELGMVDFAKFDAEHDLEIHLILSGKTLNRHTLKNPMVLVANYIFDTLRHEAFRINDGKLQEALITVTSERDAEPDLNDPGLIKRFRPKWSYHQTSHKDYFTGRQADLNPILARMVSRTALRNSSILIPVGGLNCLRNLIELTSGRLFFLSGDKAYNHENEMKGLRDPHIAIHGSFSMMVNYDAVRHYFESKGGFSMHTPYQDGFKVASFVLGAKKETVRSARLAFQLAMQTFGPDNFSTLQRSIKDMVPNPSLKLVLSLLRLSGYDSDVFYKFKQFLIDKVGHPYASEKIQQDVRRDIRQIYDCYYPLSKSKDVAFEIGRLFMSMKDYKAAMQYFIDSLRDCGEHHVTHYNLGLCHNYVGDFPSALSAFNKSLAIKPDYHEAREWRNRMVHKINQIQGSDPRGGGLLSRK
mmetsp:Transcript_27315/g.48293  ORF Transcript_27315/g.48293 Transcript_27315/m.48293 type:complete len:577 (+) Transcript_27315:113-1843(+)|eukprot:CAMPEP_0197527512 /NCGR_PEP_ID=MMETSP1318-20131121/21911_1 /TAXON_ID=552666 /ORGANISM="Partenskyella glossopodia, Strain RCC365" /LENGTH=576 /DNA_ID=CAMNT_0043082207 /DNA_START=58 /DNA_END=1788 /DNA_ORIENTATION=+